MKELKKLTKMINKVCEITTQDLGDKFKHELFVDGKRVEFIYETKENSNFDDKDNKAVKALIDNYYTCHDSVA